MPRGNFRQVQIAIAQTQLEDALDDFQAVILEKRRRDERDAADLQDTLNRLRRVFGMAGNIRADCAA